MTREQQPITEILGDVGRGDPDALHRLLPLVYAELRSLADRAVRGEKANLSVGATDLVHDAYLKLVGTDQVSWQNRAHFLAVASRAMRRILIDRARARNSQKRTPPGERVSLEGVTASVETDGYELQTLDEALNKLADKEPRVARIVEMRFFGGLQHDEIAEVEGVTARTIARDWNYAQAWLWREMNPGQSTRDTKSS